MNNIQIINEFLTAISAGEPADTRFTLKNGSNRKTSCKLVELLVEGDSSDPAPANL